MKFFQTYIGRLIVFFFIILIPIGTIGFMYYNSRVQRYIITIKKEQEKEIELSIGRMVEYFRFVDLELKTIVNQEQMVDFFSGSKGQQERARLVMENNLANLMYYSEMYDQIRIIDEHGMEKIRLNFDQGTPRVVSQEDYQFVGNEPFYQKTINLNEGEIYLSEFNLSEELGIVLDPIKPVLRIATPITDKSKSKKGVLVFNLLGETFLESLKDMGNANGWQTYMLNDSGFYLIGPNPLKEWSFQLNKAEVHLFKDEFPLINQLIHSADKATVSTSDGLFSFSMISQYNFSKVNVDVSHFTETWYVVSYLSAEKLRQGVAELFGFSDYFLLVFGFAFVVFLSFLFTNIVSKRRQYEEQLVASSHDLRVANRMKDKFISILAHDLKNPLASITGFVEILKNDFIHMSEDSRNRIVSAMDNSTKILLRLIDDVLTWARSQNDASFKDPEIIFLNKVLEDAIRFSQLQASRKEVNLVKEYKEELFALADAQMVETVLRNLISNAIKFSNRNGSIEIGMKKHDSKHVALYVRDHGVGISEKDARNIFSLDDFQTTPGTEQEKGTGMGLIICKDFVERNNGTIWVESELNKGTTFKFTLLAYHE